MGMKITDISDSQKGAPRMPESPFFLLEITGQSDGEDGKPGIDTRITVNGFEEDWQLDILKAMLTQLAAEL